MDDQAPRYTLLGAFNATGEFDQDEEEEDDEEEDNSDTEEAPSNFDVPSSSLVDSMQSNNEIDPNPLYFHQINDKGSIVIHKLKCFTCSKLNSAFFCFTCIRNGEFTSSKCSQVLKERFAEKKLKLYKLQEEKANYCHRIENLLAKQTDNDLLQLRVNQLHFNIEQLKHEIAQKQSNLVQIKEDLVAIATQQKMSKQQPDPRKLQFTKDYIKQWKDKISLKAQQVKTKENYVREETNDLTYQLKQCIFPIEPYLPEDHEGSIGRDETIPLLAYDSASSGSGYETSETKYTVIQPWISVNNEYSAYHGWVSVHSGDNSAPSPAFDHGLKNSGYRTTAALAYIAQMIDALAGLLDVRLPKRLHFSEFYSKSGVNGNDVFLNEKEFTHKIAKLNTNAVYLCLSQNVDYNMIHCRQALRNLLTLINSPYADLGRRGFVAIDPDFLLCLEANLAIDLSLIDEPIVMDYEDPSNFDLDIDWEWESIPNSNISAEPFNPDQLQSTTTFMSSAASQIWRTFWPPGQR